MISLCCGRYPKELRSIGEFIVAERPAPFARRSEVVAAIQSLFAHVEINPRAKIWKAELFAPQDFGPPDLEYLLITDWDCLIMVHLEGNKECCNELSFAIWESGKAWEGIHAVLKQFDLRAWDRFTNQFL